MFYTWDWLFVYKLRRYCVPLIFKLVNAMPWTFLVEFDWNFELFETGLLPRFFALRLFIDWFGFWPFDWLF
jgi:hypothetical protein